MRTLFLSTIPLLLPMGVFAAGGTLNQTARPLLWSGSIAGGTGPVSEVPECAPGCLRFDLTLNLPAGVWINKPGAVEVSVRWQSHTLGDNLRLYVYRNGTLIAKSDGIIAISQSVQLRTAADGLYNVYIAYDPDSPSPSFPFEALAEVEYDPNPNPARPLLPDLEVRPQRNLSFDPGGIFFDEISPTFPTCYETEVNEEGAHTCLRFDQTFSNTGEGAMELRFAVPHGSTATFFDVYQRIYKSAPAGQYQDRLAGQVEFHPVHGHYHFSSFGLSSLWSIDAQGNKTGSKPLRSRRTGKELQVTLIRSSRKVSFCLADIYIDAWAEKGNGPRTYFAPDCLLPASSDATNDYFFQGITAGWADIYDWYLPDQYIEVTGVPDGDYILETIADPDGLLAEASETNNCHAIRIRLAGMASGTPTVQALGDGPACAAP